MASHVNRASTISRMWRSLTFICYVTAMDDEKNVRDWDRIILRVPDGMRERLQARAAGNHRSMNAEILAIIGAALDTPESLRAIQTEVQRLQIEIDGTARSLNLLTDRRNRLRDMAAKMKREGGE